ncbi:MAG: hypothetical protein GMKNLPBB_02232 [Myxococcota bacterium]|nr:hypothetical protein [Myxococcota bacterium]
MVAPNQYLERPAVFQSRNLSLEGLFHRGNHPGVMAVIFSPHPHYGGSMDTPLVPEIAWQCHRQGIASLRFNYHGVGASQGGETELDQVWEDGLAAVEFMADSWPSRPVALVGYSFGAWAAMQTFLHNTRFQISGLVFASPPLEMLDFTPLKSLKISMLSITGSRDGISPPGVLQQFGESHEFNWTVDIIPEADHFYTSGLTMAGQRIAAWLDALT